MPIVFSDHAKTQIEIRNIKKQRVLQAIEKSDKIIPSFRNRKLRQKVFSGIILEVVTKTEGSKIIVITAYYL